MGHMAFRSRLGRHKAKENRRQTVLYLLLSAGVIFFMVKWGVPLLLGVLTGGGATSAKQEEKSGLPVQPPELANFPEATFSGVINIEGVAFTDQKIRLYLDNAQVKEVDTDAGGNFSFEDVSLNQGENLIGVQAVTADGRESVIRERKLIVDTSKPVIEIENPANESTFYGADQQTLEVKGKVDDGSVEVTVNDNFVRVLDNGEFSYKIKLVVGVNELVVAAVDIAGNKAEKLVRVNFSL